MKKVWGDKYGKYYKKFQKAWEDTEGKVLFYENELALTPFFRLSNGVYQRWKGSVGGVKSIHILRL